MSQSVSDQLSEKAKQFEELKQQFEEFKKEAAEYDKQLEEDNQAMEKENADLKKKLEVQTQKLDELKKESTQSNNLIEKEKDKAKKLDAELKEIKSKILALEQENETVGNENRRLAFEKTELEEKLAGLEEKLIVTTEELREQISHQAEDLERLRQESREKDEELHMLQRKTEGKSLELGGIPDSQLSNQIADLRAQLELKEQELEELQHQYDSRGEEIEKLQEENVQLHEELTLKNEEIDNLINDIPPGNPEELAALTKQVEQLKEELQSETNRLTSLLEEERSINKTLLDAKRELENSTEILKKNLDISAANEKQKDEESHLLKQNITALEQQLNELKNHNEELKKGNAELNSKLTLLEKANDGEDANRLNTSLSLLQEKLQEKDQELRKLAEENEKKVLEAKQKSENDIQKLNQKIQGLQGDLTKNDEIVSKKQAQIDSLENTAQELRQATEHVPDLLKELQDAKHAADMYLEEMNHLRQDTTEKQSSLFQKLKDFEEESERLRQDLQNKQELINNYTSSQSEITAQLQQKDDELRTKDKKVDELNESLNLKNAELEAIKSINQRDHSSDNAGALEVELATLKTVLGEKNFTIDQVTLELNELKKNLEQISEQSIQEKKSLNLKISQLSLELEEKQNLAASNESKSELNSTKQRLDAVAKELEEKELVYTGLQKEDEHKQNLLDELQKVNSDLIVNLNQAHEEISALKALGSKQDSENLAALSKEMDLVKSQLESVQGLVANKESQIVELSQQLQLKDEEISHLVAKIEELENDGINGNSESPLGQENQKLLSELENKANELKQLTSEISELKAELASAKKELQSYQTPKRISISKTASTDVSPMKRSIDDRKGSRADSQLEREVITLREQNIQLQQKINNLTKDRSFSPSKDVSFKHNRNKTEHFVPKLQLGGLSPGSKDRDTTPSKSGTLSQGKSPGSENTTLSGIGFDNTLLKPVLRSVYIKSIKGPTQSYITSQSNRLTLTKTKSRGTEPKPVTYNFDSIASTKASNFEALNSDIDPSQVLGQSFFFVLYGARHTEKKLLKYKIIEDFVEFFRKAKKTLNLGNKAISLKIRIEDPRFFSKVEYLNQNTDLGEKIRKEREFIVDNKNKESLDNYLSKLKQIDKSKLRTSQQSESKQILLDFRINAGNGSKESDTQDVSRSVEKRTKIMIVTTNTLFNESVLEDINNVQGIVDLIVTEDKNLALKSNTRTSEKNEAVKKHFILTMHPTSAYYKATLETLALASKLDNICGVINRNERNASKHRRLQTDLLAQKYHTEPPRTSKESKRELIQGDYIKEEDKSLECQELRRKLEYYANKHAVLKEQMRSLLGLLHQITSPAGITSDSAFEFNKISKGEDFERAQYSQTSKAVEKLISQIDEDK